MHYWYSLSEMSTMLLPVAHVLAKGLCFLEKQPHRTLYTLPYPKALCITNTALEIDSAVQYVLHVLQRSPGMFSRTGTVLWWDWGQGLFCRSSTAVQRIQPKGEFFGDDIISSVMTSYLGTTMSSSTVCRHGSYPVPARPIMAYSSDPYMEGARSGGQGS